MSVIAVFSRRVPLASLRGRGDGEETGVLVVRAESMFGQKLRMPGQMK